MLPTTQHTQDVHSVREGTRDRSAWLTAAGIFELFLAFGALGIIGLLLLGAALRPRSADSSAVPLLHLKLVVVYGSVMLFFVVMGVATIRAKRWARALMNAFCWLWLIFGVFTSFVLAAVLPRTVMRVGQLPQGAIIIAIVFVCCIVAFFMILVPGVLLLVYGNAGVKATCERRDPKTSWTDRFATGPLLLLVLVVIGLVSDLWIAATHPMFPAFGKYLTHAPGAVAFIITAVWRGFLARECFYLRRRGWTLVLLTFVLSFTATIVTLLRADLSAAYRDAGYSTAVIAQSTAMLRNPAYVAVLIGIMVATVVFVISMRKYFTVSTEA